ncbi:MAG: 4'-phosphopantetheinyl transferase superfamily protein, partial [Cycloclasticus sp.]|nr:4'-phosphopantetheinyl transferase superfamily protein [Cycloclasticus sp.]MBQ0789341.1 4'-phosphopantetheinyl transferase superfamily protein [Cycloclasticus sp.]
MQRHRDFIPALDDNQVDIWQFDLSADTEKWAPYAAQLLSEEDRHKINRLVQPQHRSRALAMRIQLRLLLSSYLNVTADAIRFKTGRFGKPYVAQSTITFNASHSEDKALVAIGSSAFIGVDIEFWRPLDDMSRLVERHFSNTEKLFWHTLNAGQREAVFFDLWSTKEAFIKATGRGLGMGLARCDFSLP